MIVWEQITLIEHLYKFYVQKKNKVSNNQNDNNSKNSNTKGGYEFNN